MTALDSLHPAPPARDVWFVGDRQVRPEVDAMLGSGDRTLRGIVVGNAGSGKTATLHRIHRGLVESQRDVTLVSGQAADLARVQRSRVLLIDDAHLLDPPQIAHLVARSEDPDAGLVIAARPWASDALTPLARRLERDRPALVLGHVSRSDILTYLEQQDRSIEGACVDHILGTTWGMSWLVAEAISIHDARDCASDPSHRELTRMMQARIAHRLGTIPGELRSLIEARSLSPVEAGAVSGGTAPSTASSIPDDLIMRGYAEGLLLRSGQPVPLVRSTVLATTPAHRLIDLSSAQVERWARAAKDGDTTYRDLVGVVADPRVGDALAREAALLTDTHPHEALDLYRTAMATGADHVDIAAGHARAAWTAGDLVLASGLLDSAPSATRSSRADFFADTAAAVWAARCMMDQSVAVYRSSPPRSPATTARALVAGFGTGMTDECAGAARDTTTEDAAPSALGVSLELLRQGLRASLSGSGDAALGDLVRASELYTVSRSSDPIPELPAVVAAVAAISLGELGTAQSVIDEAVSGGHGGLWARPRLLLWRSWISMQRARPVDAREALASASDSSRALSPRDALLAHAIRVAIARRYEDLAGLEAVWRLASPTILRADIDVYLLLPLAELVASAAKLGDTARLQALFARGLAIVEGLGSPALWSTHLRWAGIQQGILHGKPEDLNPHARALVSAAAHSRVAARMAKAGRVWTSVLAGTVDADSVESAAEGIAEVGLAWDAARLAGHGAGRTTDRRIASRLLSCARDLHPNEAARRPGTATGTGTAEPAASDAELAVLSERELEVARLVLQGKTYAEIGETIFISPRTAEHHIAHIRRRLGAISRSDMIAKLRVLVDGSIGGGSVTTGTADVTP